MGKILITGVAGLLGSRLADWIVNNTDYKVIGIDDLSGGFSENINRKIEFYKFNLIDLQSLKGVFEKENIEIVYHFAAYAAEGLSPFIRKYNYENNLIASTNLITCGIQYNISRFVIFQDLFLQAQCQFMVINMILHLVRNYLKPQLILMQLQNMQ